MFKFFIITAFLTASTLAQTTATTPGCRFIVSNGGAKYWNFVHKQGKEEPVNVIDDVCYSVNLPAVGIIPFGTRVWIADRGRRLRLNSGLFECARGVMTPRATRYCMVLLGVHKGKIVECGGLGCAPPGAVSPNYCGYPILEGNCV